ncbi:MULTISPECIES: hypothetical protein [Stenotrophomonas]|uniref:hypothetical protein n=1 Tax=Stenotrophomonas TaxID=40323 RepID=UPI0012E3D302|nr:MULTISPECIES: hypothetical protein [Stenotrophomonas]
MIESLKTNSGLTFPKNRAWCSIRHFLSGIVAVLAMAPVVAMCTGAQPKLELRARCLIDDSCSFAGETIRVELELINVGDKAIALPVEYFRKQGPKVILVDNHSNKEKRLGMGPPRSYLFDQMQELAPGQAIRIPWSIPDHDISRFASQPVSITAIFRFYLAPGSSLSAKEFVSTQLLIEGD